MKLYFYGGSFDPPHLAHKEIVNYFSNKCEKFLIVPSYKSPLKLRMPISFSHRKEMLRIMFENSSNKLEIINFENNNKILYTYKTIKYLKNKYPNHTLNMIVGLDQYNKLDRWKNDQYIKNNVKISVISRPGHKYINNEEISFIDAISFTISSEYIKNNFNQIEKIKHMLDKKVLKYIIKNKLYI